MPTLSKSRILSRQIGETIGAEAFVYHAVEQNRPAAQPAGSAAGRLDPAIHVLWGPSPNRSAQQASPGPTPEEIAAREQRAYESGFREADSRLRAELEKALTAERSRISKSLEEFRRERQAYFQQVEAEVVSLALGIARKILHREAQMDPLLMAGMVRVALEKISTGSSVKLRVPPAEVSRWMDIIESQEGLEPQPEVVGDPAIAAGECMLETEVGSADLSMEAQLKEIESGFFDLLAVKPE